MKEDKERVQRIEQLLLHKINIKYSLKYANRQRKKEREILRQRRKERQTRVINKNKID